MKILFRYRLRDVCWKFLSRTVEGALSIKNMYLLLKKPTFSERKDKMVLLFVLCRLEEADWNEVVALYEPSFCAILTIQEVKFVLEWRPGVLFGLDTWVKHYYYLVCNCMTLTLEVTEMTGP